MRIEEQDARLKSLELALQSSIPSKNVGELIRKADAIHNYIFAPTKQVLKSKI